MGRLDGKVAVVTGAARGIGRAVAERYIAEGAAVLIGDCDEAGHDTARSLGAKCRFVRADVGDADDAGRLVSEACTAFGAVDILVNNAGIIHAADFLELAEADFDRVLRVNLKGAFLVGQAAARQMVVQVTAGRPAGAIINMSSINATLAIPNQTPYCVSKGGLSQLTKVMSLALAPHRIRVNAVAPGITNTAMPRLGNSEERLAELARQNPSGRMAEPDDIADVIVFLATDEARHIVGQLIHVNGGDYLG